MKKIVISFYALLNLGIMITSQASITESPQLSQLKGERYEEHIDRLLKTPPGYKFMTNSHTKSDHTNDNIKILNTTNEMIHIMIGDENGKVMREGFAKPHINAQGYGDSGYFYSSLPEDQIKKPLWISINSFDYLASRSDAFSDFKSPNIKDTKIASRVEILPNIHRKYIKAAVGSKRKNNFFIGYKEDSEKKDPKNLQPTDIKSE